MFANTKEDQAAVETRQRRTPPPPRREAHKREKQSCGEEKYHRAERNAVLRHKERNARKMKERKSTPDTRGGKNGMFTFVTYILVYTFHSFVQSSHG
jgi:hypothetical protein